MCWYPEFWQTCISAKHIIPPSITERKSVPGLSRCGSINSASCSKRKASLVLHMNLEDQAVYQAYPRQKWKDLRSCWPTLPLRRKRVAQNSRCCVSWFSINCLLESMGWWLVECRVAPPPKKKALPKKRESWTFSSLVSEKGLWF